MDAQKQGGGVDLSELRIDESARNNTRGKRGRRISLLIALALIIIIVVFFVLRGSTPVVEVASARSVGSAGSATLLNASGYVTPRRRATIAAKITARVLDVMVDEGMSVAKGQILAQLDGSDAQRRLRASQTSRDAMAALIANLEVNLANAEREFNRQKELEKAGVAAVQTRENAQTAAESLRAQIAAAREQVKASEAQIGVAQQDLDNCTVRAPFAGVVVSKDAQIGEMVSPISAGGGFTRTGIATLVDMASLEIEVDVNESYIARVQPDQKVEAVLDAYPDWRIPCKVRTVIPTADRQKATVKVRISFDKLDPRILPDMGVKVAFLADEKRAGATVVPKALIPQAAVREASGQKFVILVNKGLLERRAVTVGEIRGSDIEIMAGVREGDAVVVGGPEGLRDGGRVKVK